jgi:hypothetical protein
LWCNEWKQDAECGGDEISDKKGLSTAQCIDYCNQRGAGCCRIKTKDGECNAHKSKQVKPGEDRVCADSQYRPYSKPSTIQDDLPRPTKNESVVMFLLEDTSMKKLNDTYKEIGSYLWSKMQFAAAKRKIEDCAKEANKPCTKFSECPETCAHKQLKIFMEMAPKATPAPTASKRGEEAQDEEELEEGLQADTGYESSSLPQPKSSSETVAWVQTGGTDPDELGAALSDAINQNRITGTKEAVQIERGGNSGVAGLQPSLFVGIAVMAAAVSGC